MTHSNFRGAGAENPGAKLTNETAREMQNMPVYPL
jgi:hypothetical protein